MLVLPETHVIFYGEKGYGKARKLRVLQYTSILQKYAPTVQETN